MERELSITELRIQKDIPQSIMAKKLGVPLCKYIRYETGMEKIPQNIGYMIARIFGVNANSLFLPESLRLKKKIEIIEESEQSVSDYKDVSSLVKARKNNNKTQEDMAYVLGISLSTYNMYEKGNEKVPKGEAIRIAEILCVNVESIFSPHMYTVKKLKPRGGATHEYE